LAALRSLSSSCDVVGILRSAAEQVDDPVRALAAEAGVPVRAVAGLEPLAAVMSELQPDVVVISSFRQILPASILSHSRFVNVHYSLLPQYRGRANVNWAIINGEPAAGISIHLVSPDLDGGNLLYQEAVPIGPDDTVTDLYARLNAIQERELGQAVLRANAGAPGLPQDTSQSTYGCSRVADDGEIDWKQPSDVVYRLIRALAPPFPGAFTHLDAEQLIVVRASPVPNPPVYAGRIAGRVVGRSSAEGWVDVLTGDGVMRLFEVVAASHPGAPCPAAKLIRSTRVGLGLSRLDLLRRIEQFEGRIAELERLAAQPR
jgi:methionyl-tRNA formyltransferase